MEIRIGPAARARRGNVRHRLRGRKWVPGAAKKIFCNRFGFASLRRATVTVRANSFHGPVVLAPGAIATGGVRANGRAVAAAAREAPFKLINEMRTRGPIILKDGERPPRPGDLAKQKTAEHCEFVKQLLGDAGYGEYYRLHSHVIDMMNNGGLMRLDEIPP